MIGPNRRWLGGFVLLVVLLPSGARAQSMARSFQELQQIVRAGETVVVADGTGRETKGKVLDLSPSSLVLLANGGTATNPTFAETTVTKITRVDPLRNGSWIGLGVAIAGTFGLVRLGADISIIGCGSDEPGVSIPLCLGLIAGAGAAIGARIDAMVKQVVYTSPSQKPGVTLSPMFGKGRAGALVSVRF